MSPPVFDPAHIDFAAYGSFAEYCVHRTAYLEREVYPKLLDGEVEREVIMQETDKIMIYPIDKRYANIMRLGNSIFDSTWNHQSVDVTRDAQSFVQLSPNAQRLLELIMLFFALADNAVNANIMEELLRRVKAPEITAALSAQIGHETTHQHAYQHNLHSVNSKLNLMPAELLTRSRLLDNPVIKNKVEWLKGLNTPTAPLAMVVASAICMEYLQFQGNFLFANYLKSLGAVPGFCTNNYYIERDENIHAELDIEIYSLLAMQLPPQVMYMLIRECLELEHQFYLHACPTPQDEVPGFSVASVMRYLRVRANKLCIRLGLAPLYPGETHDMNFMLKKGTLVRSDFFSTNTADYARSASVRVTAEIAPRLGELFGPSLDELYGG